MPIELKGQNYYSKVFKRINYKLSNSTFWVVINVFNDDAYIGGTYHLGGNGLKEKALKGISDEEVYKLQFDCIDDA